MLRNSRGDLTGNGSEADKALWVKINVLNVDLDSRYEFLVTYRSGGWGTAAGRGCPVLESQIKPEVLYSWIQGLYWKMAPRIDRSSGEFRKHH